MLVGGLNNLGFVPQAAKTAKGQPSSTEGRDDLSFEEALGQAADNEAPETAGDKAAPKVSAKESSQASPSNIPGGGPSIPSVERPILSDRVSPMAVNPPLAKMAEPTAKMGDEAVNSLTKRVVWNDFLRKMKNELGVSAEDVLNAFASLSEEELSLPPEQSVDKVVMALGLDGQQANLAKQYFSELIRKTKPQSLGQELARSERDISLTLMSQRDIERRMNQKSVDRMQQQFFMNGAYPRTPTAAAGAAGAAASAQAGSAAQNMPLSAAGQAPVTSLSTPTTDATAPAFNPNPMTSANASVSAEKSAIKLDENFKPVAEEKPAADVDSLIKKFMTGQAESARMQSAPAAVSVAPEAATAAAAQAAPTTTPAPAAAQLALQQIFGGQREGSNASAGQDEGEYTADASYLASTAGLEGQLGKTQGPSEFQTQLSSVQGSQPMAVQDIVQQARVMVHDGGGEMKVTLRPDGLGEVAMRVSVNDGKVNVQMITESDEAKRLIERQLGDLKTSLTSQHLSVDSIKVDTATNLGKQLEQQYNDAQRQMAQQTLEQYRQDQQGWRRSFFEVPSARVYKDQTEAPRDVKAPSASSRRAGNRRLDLVA